MFGTPSTTSAGFDDSLKATSEKALEEAMSELTAGVEDDPIAETVSGERSLLRDAMDRAAGRLPVSDPDDVDSKFRLIRAKAQENIEAIKQALNNAQDTYNEFVDRGEAAAKSQMRIVSMVDAALSAVEADDVETAKKKPAKKAPAKNEGSADNDNA